MTADLADRARYGYWWRENIRFSDTDLVGHVNNVAYAALLESGRTAFTHETRFPRSPANAQVVMARIEIDYRRELHWPATVDIGSRITAIGNRSYRIGSGIFLGERCICTGLAVLVMIDRTTRRAVDLPDEYRAYLEQACR